MGSRLEHGPLGAEEVSENVAQVIERLIREVPDFPEPGIQFKDLTPVLADPAGLAAVTAALAAAAAGCDLVAGLDARGFLLGAAVATTLGTGVLAVRKGGKLPPPVLSESYTLEYGTATFEIPAEGIDLTGSRVLVVDDVLATGGTLAAATRLLAAGGATVVGAAVVLELTALNGRRAVSGVPITSLYTL
jgi:adenine phosphoribosyltransferase